MPREISDPMELALAAAFDDAGISYRHESEARPEESLGLDFYLPEFGVYVEVKQFHSQRIARQMARAENVIAIQGRRSLDCFIAMLKRGPHQI